ncbi:MAG: DUF3536 domain-containing protein [Cyanobacteria bacterium P01_A01_bin.84]
MTSAADLPANVGAKLNSPSHSSSSTPPDALKTATGVYVTVHGHFYQPPRENPYIDTIESQPGAEPFHDWNERIHHECYRPNAFARICDDRGKVVGIVNNYEYFSFNIGPTLMSWLERHDVEVYQRILEADRKSGERLNGHGNAIAQVYNHIIMPLANQRDKYTQIRWGKADFRSRFKRDPEGMWLAETAVDYATVEALIDEGIKFIILAPSQAKRCRMVSSQSDPDPEWHEVGGSQIDATRPYRCYLKEGKNSGRYIDVFFYDGPISRDMGFSDVVYNSHHFAGRIGAAVRGDHRPSQLISVATDGETFGHHKQGTEKTLAYAFTQEFPQKGWTVTNFAHYLSLNQPTWEVELKSVTAWSCAHGVDRWQDDCGCGGAPGWHLLWRKPLRDALNWLRDRLVEVYDQYGAKFFREPWKARDEYIEIIRDRAPENVEKFLSNHQNHQLSELEKVDALRLLEMQRHALLMFTSCGWFFEEISRPEGTQILRYAARALELAGDVSGAQLEADFLEYLEKAPTNISSFKNGSDIYHQLVLPAKISPRQVAAHYAISSLFQNYRETSSNTALSVDVFANSSSQQKRIYCYTTNELDFQLQRMGSLTLAVGQLQLTSEITLESEHLVFAVIHLGGWDFHCCIQPFEGRLSYSQLKDKLFTTLKQASASKTILLMTQLLGEEAYSLENLCAEERHRIARLLSEETLTRLDQLYTQVYRDNYSILVALHRDGQKAPLELQVAAEVALGYRCMLSLRSLEQDISEPQLTQNHLIELEAIASEAKHLHIQLKIPEGKQILEQLIMRSLWQLLHDSNGNFEEKIQTLEKLVDTAHLLNIGISFDKAQEIYWSCLYSQIVPNLEDISNQEEVNKYRQLLKLGQKLAVEVAQWFHKLG